MNRRRHPVHRTRSPFATFFTATLGVALAAIAVATLFAGGCCGLLVAAGEAQTQSQGRSK